MNVIGFVGSPRKGGNCEILVRQVLAGAEEAGDNTTIFYLDEMDIEPCHACRKCAEGNGCVTDDDMYLLYDELESADAIVVASPIYYGQMSAQVKLFTDRFYAVSNDPKKDYEGKKAVLIFTQQAPDGTYDDYIDLTVKSPYGHMGFDVVGKISASGLEELDAVRKDQQLMDKAKMMGKTLFED